MDEKIYSLGLQFESTAYYHMDSGRKMMLQLIDGFLDLLNTSDCIKPYLYCLPFSSSHLEISINFIDDCKYSYFSAGQLKYLSFSDGVITYYGENGCGDLEKLQEEPLEFSRRLIALESKSEFSLNPCHPKY